MVKLIAFPFRVAKNGSVATREDGSVECLTEEIALLCLTKPGERELVPEYGLNDIEYEGVIQEELASKIALFGPDVNITNLKSSHPREGEQRIVVEYEPLTDDSESEESFNV